MPISGFVGSTVRNTNLTASVTAWRWLSAAKLWQGRSHWLLLAPLPLPCISRVIDHLGRGCRFARLHLQALPLTFQFVLRDSISFFFPLIYFNFQTFRWRLVSALPWRVCFNVTPTSVNPTAKGREPAIAPDNRFLQNKLKTAEQAAAGIQNLTLIGERPLQGQQIMFCLGGLRGSTLITSVNWTARLSSRQALGQQELVSVLLWLLPALPRELLGALTSHAE